MGDDTRNGDGQQPPCPWDAKTCCPLAVPGGCPACNLPMSSYSDELLMTHYYGGHHPSFEEIHRRYFNRLIQRALFLLPQTIGKQELAEDCAAQALEKAALPVSTGSRWDPAKGKFSPWLNAILFNEVMTYRRRLRRQEIHESDLPKDENGNGLQIDQAHVGSEPNPLGQLLSNERDVFLADSIEQLPDNQQRVIRLLFQVGFTQTEVARLLEVSDATVMRWRLEAVRQLINDFGSARRFARAPHIVDRSMGGAVSFPHQSGLGNPKVPESNQRSPVPRHPIIRVFTWLLRTLKRMVFFWRRRV